MEGKFPLSFGLYFITFREYQKMVGEHTTESGQFLLSFLKVVCFPLKLFDFNSFTNRHQFKNSYLIFLLLGQFCS